MGFNAWLRSKEKRFAWSLLGALIGMASLLLTYQAARDKHARLTFSLTNEANIYNLHSHLAGLQILFLGADLEKENLNLRILTIQLQNVGGTDILQSHYDSVEPWGVTVTGSRIIEARVVGASSDYLRSHINPQWDGDRLTLAKPILERGKFVVLDVLVTHRRDHDPTIVPFGKIAGIDSFEVNRPNSRTQGDGLFRRSLAGSPGVQALRLISYPILLVLSAAGLVGLIALGSSLFYRLTRNRRKHEVARVLKNVKNEVHRRFLEQLYMSRGPLGLAQLNNILGDPEGLRQYVAGIYVMRNLRSLATTRPLVGELEEVWENERLLVSHPTISLVDEVINAGLVKLTKEEQLEISDGLLADIRSVLN